jgi:protein O-mannosyl-transferase
VWRYSLDRAWLIAFALAAAAFSPALSNGFVDWDDNVNFLTNPHYRGLGLAQIQWMFTSALSGHWIPVTWLTLGLDYVIWGMNPFGYHLTSILFHAANAALLFVVARRLIARAIAGISERDGDVGACAAALVWALHPMRVESVAWITERRDVVSGTCALLTVLAYLTMTERHGVARRLWLGIALAAYATALAAKSIVMGLPIVLLLLDLYPLRRGVRLFPEKLIFFALAMGFAAVSFVVAAHAWPVTPLAARSIMVRAIDVGHVVVFYVAKTLMPTRLTPLYESRPTDLMTFRNMVTVLAAVALVVVAGALARRHRPGPLVALLSYAVLVAPVSGVVHIGAILVADRYSYLSTMPLAILLGGVVALVAARSAAVTAIAVGVLLVTLAWLTWGQVHVWRTTETLWRSAIAVDPACALCQSQLGSELGNRGRLPEAMVHLAEAVRLRPDHPPFHRNLALALLKSGRPDEAAARYSMIVSWYPEDAESLTRLGAALLGSARPADAVLALERAARLRPAEREVRYLLAQAYASLGRSVDALGQAEAMRPIDARLADDIVANVRATRTR